MDKDSQSYNVIIKVDNGNNNNDDNNSMKFGLVYGNDYNENTKVICVFGNDKKCKFTYMNFMSFITGYKYYQIMGFDQDPYTNKIVKKNINNLLLLEQFKYQGFETEKKLLYCLGKNIDKFIIFVKKCLNENKFIKNGFLSDEPIDINYKTLEW